MRPSMLIDDLIIGRGDPPVFERPHMWVRYRQYCNFTRWACSTCVGGKPQAASRKLSPGKRTTCHYCYNATSQPQGRPQPGETPPFSVGAGAIFRGFWSSRSSRH